MAHENDIPQELFTGHGKKWIILIQYGISVEPAYWEEDTPMLFDTKEAAQKLSDDDFNYLISRQKEEVASGDRDEEDVWQENEEWVSECTIDENGCISTKEDGLIYGPKTFVR